MKSKQTGFTLIELVAVIVLLGILAVTALPRFVNLQSDARAATLDALSASMEAAAVQVYAKALIAGTETSDNVVADAIAVPPNTIETVQGFPAADSGAAPPFDGILGAIDYDPTIFTNDTGEATTTNIIVGYDLDADGDVSNDNCFVTYNESTGNGVAPVVGVTDTGC